MSSNNRNRMNINMAVQTPDGPTPSSEAQPITGEAAKGVDKIAEAHKSVDDGHKAQRAPSVKHLVPGQ